MKMASPLRERGVARTVARKVNQVAKHQVLNEVSIILIMIVVCIHGYNFIISVGSKHSKVMRTLGMLTRVMLLNTGQLTMQKYFLSLTHQTLDLYTR